MSQSINLQSVFLPSQETQNKPEWQLVRKNLMFSTERPDILVFSVWKSVCEKNLNCLCVITLRKKKQKKKSYNNNQKLVFPPQPLWDCNSEKISCNVLLVLCARTFTALNRTSLQNHFLYSPPCSLVRRLVHLILNCDFPFWWPVTDLPSPLLFPFVFTDSLLF